MPSEGKGRHPLTYALSLCDFSECWPGKALGTWALGSAMAAHQCSCRDYPCVPLFRPHL